jgi:hypothetical protein
MIATKCRLLALALGSMTLGGMAVASAAKPPSPPPARTSSPGAARLQSAYGKLPLAFEENRGQTDPRVKFLSRGPGYGLFLTPTEAVLSLSPSGRTAGRTGGQRQLPRQKATAEVSTVLRMRLLGGHRAPKVFGVDRLPGKVNYLRGNDPRRWRTGVPTYGKVRYHGVYPGVDLVYYGDQRRLEYDFIVAPGADPRRVRLGFIGARAVRLEKRGDLLLQTAAGASPSSIRR